jgi:hypothetical protein
MCLDRYPDHWAHCMRCHQTMAGLTAFDQHYAAGRVCAVMEAGLVAGHVGAYSATASCETCPDAPCGQEVIWMRPVQMAMDLDSDDPDALRDAAEEMAGEEMATP